MTLPPNPGSQASAGRTCSGSASGYRGNPHHGRRPRSAGAGARAASGDHLQGVFADPSRDLDCAGRGLARGQQERRPRNAAAAGVRLSGMVGGRTRISTTTSATSGPFSGIKSRPGVGKAAAAPKYARQRKVRAPQSGMQGNSLARRRDEQGHRDESLIRKTWGGETRQPPSGATQIGSVGGNHGGRLDRACG